MQNSASVSAGEPGAQATSSNASAIGETPSYNARRQSDRNTPFIRPMLDRASAFATNLYLNFEDTLESLGPC